MPDVKHALNTKNRLLVLVNFLAILFSGAYTVSPIDLLPELVFGPFGYADDLIGMLLAGAFTLYTINTLRHRGVEGLKPSRMQAQTDPSKIIDVLPEGEAEPVPVGEIESR